MRLGSSEWWKYLFRRSARAEPWPEVKGGVFVVMRWSGPVEQRVHVVGQTPSEYCIRAITMTRLPGRNRWLKPGHTTLVRKSSVRLDAPPEQVSAPSDNRGGDDVAFLATS